MRTAKVSTPMPRCFSLLLLLVLALALVHAALGDSLDDAAKVTVTTADGRERELSAAEFEALARERHDVQSELQREPQEQWRHDQTMEDVARDDPELARLITVARRAFGALQWYGHAPNKYALTGFSEKEEHQPTPDEREDELRVVLELQAASEGGNSGEKIAFDVDVLLDAEHRVRLLSAWKLDGPGGKRAQRLRVDGEDAPTKKQRVDHVKLLLLGGGVVLIAGGALVLYGSRPPTWAKAKERAEAEARARKTAMKTTVNKSQQQWALDDKKSQ